MSGLTGLEGRLSDLMAGLAMGSTPQESMAYGGRMMALRGGQREQEAQKLQQRNHTFQWLQSQGVDAGAASYLVSDRDALRSWFGEFQKGQKPNWQIHDLADGKYMVDMNDPTRRNKISGPKPEAPTYGVINKDEFGTEKYGWIDRTNQTTTPAQPMQQAPAAPAASQTTLPRWTQGIVPPSAAPAPAPVMPSGVDPKEWREMQTKKTFADQAGRERKEAQAGIVVQDIDRALKLTKDSWTPVTGGTGGLLSYIPGTASHDLSNLLTTIKANAGFDQLQAMRAASPTGGALGSVSNEENTLLQSVIGSLEQSQSEQQFKDNLRRVKNTYLDIVHGKGTGPARETLSFEDGGTSGSSRDGWTDLGNGIKMRKVK